MVSSFRTARLCNSWGSPWIGHWKTTWSMFWSSAPQPQAAEGPYPTCTRRSRNVWHRCGGGWVGSTLFCVSAKNFLQVVSITWCQSDYSFRLFKNNWKLVWSIICFKFALEETMFQVCFGGGHGLFGLILAAILHAVLGSAIPGGCYGDKSTESRSAPQPFYISPHFCYCRQMNWWVVEQQAWNGCFHLRHRAFPLDGQVSAEWSRCQGSMGRRARDRVALLQRSSAGWMTARIGRLSTGVGHRYPVAVHKASLMAGQWGRCEHCGTSQECSTLLFNGPGLR